MIYGLTQTAPPYAEPVSLDEAKLWLREDGDESDALIGGLVASAREYVEAATGVQLVTATLSMTFTCFPHGGLIRLPRRPALAVSSVTYVDVAGDTQTWSSALYQADLPLATMRPAWGEYWPTARGDQGGIAVTFVAGYATPFTAVASSDVLTLRGRSPTNGERVRLTGSALPGGLSALTDYYAVQSSGATCKLSLTDGGSAVDVTADGAGFVGEVPAGLRTCLQLLLAHWWRNREGVVTGAIATEVPLAVQSLLVQGWTGEV